MFSEPISGSAPKFTIDSKLSLVERKLAEPLTLVCPAQGSPVPGYRSASNFSSSLVNTSPRQWKVHPPSCFEHSEANCQPACLLFPVSPLTLNFERKKLCLPVRQLKGIPSGQSAFQTTLYYRTCWWISSKVFGKKFRICFDRKIFASLQSGLSCAGFSYSSI